MLSQLLNRPCIIVRTLETGTTDDYGNLVPDEDAIDTVCELQQQGRSEPTDDLSVTNWLLILPPGTRLRTDDYVIVDSERYELVGDPWVVRSPRTQQEAHVEATVKRAGTEEVGS